MTSHLPGSPSPRVTTPSTVILSLQTCVPSRVLTRTPSSVLWRVLGWIFWEEAPLPHQVESHEFWCALMTRTQTKTVVDWWPHPPLSSTTPRKKCQCHIPSSGAPPPTAPLSKLRMTSKFALLRRVPPPTHVTLISAWRESHAPFKYLASGVHGSVEPKL